MRLTDAIHETGAKVAGQVGHAGPVANGRSNGVRALSASRMPSPLSMQMIGSASEQDLTRITQAYVAAARLLVRAGFDVLELHMAHSYLISSFLAPGLNRRKDRWNGSLENRARLGRQVAKAVRDEVGGEVAVTAKVSLSDGFKGGVTTEAGLEFAQLLEADGNLDALQMSGGSSLMNPMYLFRGEVPLKEFAASMPLPVRLGMKTPIGKSFMKQYPFEEAYFWDKAIRFREALAMPLMLLGGINRVDTMERAMERGLRLRGHGEGGPARARPRQPPRLRPRHRRHLHPLQPLHADHLLRHPLPRRHRRLTACNSVFRPLPECLNTAVVT